MRRLIGLVPLLGLLAPCSSAELPEYQLKAAFLYNFAQFTDWPTAVGPRLRLCTYGEDPFGAHLDGLADKPVGERALQLQRRVTLEALTSCNILYVGRAAIDSLPTLHLRLAGRPVLVVADSPGAVRAGAALNMTVAKNRITFEANRKEAAAAGLVLNSGLLRLATEVVQ